MANGDITSVVINSDQIGTTIVVTADITVEGWGPDAGSITYDYDGTMTFTVVSEGYTAGVLGTRTRTITGTDTFRQPYPNEATLDETVSGSDLIIRVALSEEIYNDDKNGGAGTSGTDPTVTIAAGWANNGSGDNAATTDLTCTNNSTLDYPKVIGQWDWILLRGGWRRMSSDFTVGFDANHGYGIDQVTLSAIGATSAVDTNSDVTSLSSTESTETGLFCESYQMSVTLSSYTQAEQIDLRAIAYPRIGDADSILDTNDVTAAGNRVQGNTTCFVMCDKTGGMRTFATVDPDDGDDGTGATTTSEATYNAGTNPYLTVAAARDAGATVIGVLDSTATPDINGSASSTITNGWYVEVTTHPSAVGTVTLNRPGSNQQYNTDYLCFDSIDISYSSGNGWLDGANGARQILFDNVGFNNTETPLVGLGYRSNGVWMINCSGVDTDDYLDFSSNRIAYVFVGCTHGASFDTGCWYTAKANKSTAATNVIYDEKAAANAAPTQDNVIYSHNQFYDVTANGVNNSQCRLGVNAAITGVVLKCNIIEISTVTSSGPIFWLGGDGSTFALNNVILAHNTLAGERVNVFYNDSGSSAVERTQIFVYGNALRSYNIKSDTFASSPNGNRTGNWMSAWAYNYHDNVYDGSASAAFTGEIDGTNNSFELSGTINVFGELGYVDENSADTDGTGNGDYTPDTGSVLLDRTIPNDFIGFDSFGNTKSNTIGGVFVVTPGSGAPSRALKIGLGIGI